MIRIERNRPPPASLVKAYSGQVKPPKIPGKTERDAVVQRLEEHLQAGKPPDKFKFPYERYSDREVIDTLHDMFQGKCAYCESRYAGTQPMDVEHWRPKGEIKDTEGPSIKPGYYWLASEWSNLLPSCIDCNRGRRQFDKLEGKNVVLGKKNQFPLADPGLRILRHTDDPDNTGAAEPVLLINPCLEDPEALLVYNEEGLVLPRNPDQQHLDHLRAMASIRVYALNRAELVTERLAVILGMDHRITLIDTLGSIRDSLTAQGLVPEADAIADLIAAEIDALLAMRRADQPFAGLARHVVSETGLA